MMSSVLYVAVSRSNPGYFQYLNPFQATGLGYDSMKLFLARNRLFRSVTAVKNGYCWVKTLSAANSPNFSRLQSSIDINDGAQAACAASRPLATSPAISSFRHSALLILQLLLLCDVIRKPT